MRATTWLRQEATWDDGPSNYKICRSRLPLRGREGGAVAVTTWEYKAVKIAVDRAEHTERECAKLGRAGWKLVALVPLGGNPPYALATFKRQRAGSSDGGGIGGLSY